MDVQFIENKLSRRPHSPLFARLAGEYLISGDVEKALELCSSGIARYPQYSTACLVRAKCFAAKQDYVSALLNLKDVLDVFPDSALLHGFEQEWKELAVRQEIAKTVTHTPSVPDVSVPEHAEAESPATSQPGVMIEDQTITPVIAHPVVEPEPVGEVIVSAPPVIEPAIPDSVEVKLKPQSKDVKPHVDKDSTERTPSSPKVFLEGERIVSKTLAEIYANQGEYEEAIITYRLLQQQRPKQAEEFGRRIKDLEEKKESK